MLNIFVAALVSVGMTAFTVEALLKSPEHAVFNASQTLSPSDEAVPATTLLSPAISPICMIANNLKNPTLTELQMLFGFGGRSH